MVSGVDGGAASAAFSFDAPRDTGCRFLCWLSPRNTRNLLYANTAGWVSAAGGWIGSFFASSVWGVLAGGATSALGNLISTWLVWERPWDRQVQYAAMEAFPVLANQLAVMEARMDNLQRALDAGAAQTKQPSRSSGGAGGGQSTPPLKPSPVLSPSSRHQSPASKRANSRRNRASDAPLSVSVNVSAVPFAGVVSSASTSDAVLSSSPPQVSGFSDAHVDRPGPAAPPSSSLLTTLTPEPPSAGVIVEV